MLERILAQNPCASDEDPELPCCHYGSYRHFRRPEAAENKPFAAENKLFSAASGRQKNRPKIRLIFGGWLSGRRK
jgi:hypothetical protein